MYATSSRSTTGTPTPSWRARSRTSSASEPGQRRGVRVREREHLRPHPGQRPRAGRLPRPADVAARQPVDHGAADHDRRLQARVARGGSRRSMPYYAYGRSDKKDQPRVPITARLIADMITVAGADRMLTMDLHQGQIQGFFNIPVDELTAVHMLSRLLHRQAARGPASSSRTSASPSARGTFAEILDAPLAIIEKRRHGNLDRAEVINVIGDVRGKRAIIVDDEIDTGGHADRDHARARARGRDRDLRLRHARRAVRPGDRPDRELGAGRGRHHRHHPAARRQADRRRSRCCRSRRSSARRSSASTAASPWARCSAPRSRSPRRCSCGRTAGGGRSAGVRRGDDDDVPSPMPAPAGA